jgi:hypothetical protein
MNRKRLCGRMLLGLALWGGWPAVADAAPPWAKLVTLNRVDADPEKTYRLSEENGPWMITACSFSGEGAETQARQLAFELRKRYKLPAYIHRAEFQFGAAEGRGMFGAPLRMKHRVDDLQEVAVLVGNFQAADDPAAQKTLQKLKYTHPNCLDVKQREKTNQSLAGWRTFFQERVLAPGSKHKDRGPLGHAFITTNPLLPKEFFAPTGIDPLVLDMNKDVTHSLLDCPGRYTVQVATFKGNVFIQPKEIEAVESGKQIKSQLAEAAKKAHTLTEALRMKGWEAYEFHDRYASIVTVGSFDSVGTPRPDGKTEINPRVHAIMQTFGAQQAPGLPEGVRPLRSLVGIPFDIQPIPVEVPKRSISREMAARR